MYCSNCGVKVQEGSRFCASCGRELGDNNRLSEEVPSVPTSRENISETKSQDKDKLLVLVAHLGAAFFSFFAPLVVYLIRKEDTNKEDWVKGNAISALNFQLTVFLVLIGCLISLQIISNRIESWTLPMFLDGTMESLGNWANRISIFILIVIAIDFIYCVVAAINSTGGRIYRYPISIRFIRFSGLALEQEDKVQQQGSLFVSESENVNQAKIAQQKAEMETYGISYDETNRRYLVNDTAQKSKGEKKYFFDLGDAIKYAQSLPRQHPGADETLAFDLPPKSETSWKKYSLLVFTMILLGSAFYLLKPKSYRVETPQNSNGLVTELSYDQYREKFLNNNWSPLDRIDRPEGRSELFPEIQVCTEDGACFAEFINASDKEVTRMVLRFCSSIINNCLDHGNKPDRFVAVVREVKLDIKSANEDWLELKKQLGL